MSDANPPSPAVTGWLAQNMRLTVFPESSQLGYEGSWWRDLTGSDPDVDTRKKQERTESGDYEGVQLTLTVNPVRVQWSLSIPFSQDNFGEQGLLGPFENRCEWFKKVVTPWLLKVNPVSRIAFGASLFYPVDNRESGYQYLNSILEPVEIDIESTDFMYRVNRIRPSSSGVADLTINRLATWGALKVAFVLQQLSDIASPEIASKDESFFCHLELDVNTSGDFQGVLQPQALPTIFEELVNIGIETARLGDRRATS